ncbi:YggT family protein [Helcobacillus sp. ACRRO]|uniref:YggT family protein n=1 Tax=Helcobacillus sp. ACRRO TaxID=2918202 RepID=UPI001EF5F756|nr:YggT family protein [Helcobacillus sp. ACRRO]
MTTLLGLLFLAVFVFRTLLIVRIVLEIIQSYSRGFRPHGIVLILFEVVYTVTDPPVKALRKVIPPLRLGQVSLDLSVLVLFIACMLAEGALTGLITSAA